MEIGTHLVDSGKHEIPRKCILTKPWKCILSRRFLARVALRCKESATKNILNPYSNTCNICRFVSLTAHLLPSSSGYSTLPAATSLLWATDDNISNLEGIKHWHCANRLLFDFLFLRRSGAAASFLLQFKPKRGDLANGRLLGMVWLENIKMPPANVNV